MARWLLLFLTGCATTLPIYVHQDTDTPEARTTIDEGAAFFGIDTRYVEDEDDAVVTVEFVQPKDGKCGHARRDGVCTREIKTCSGPVFAGHEIGHAMGLKHTCEASDEEPGGKGCPGTIMDYAPPNVAPTVTRKQKDRARATAAALATCTSRNLE
jgi:hypothetical protein